MDTHFNILIATDYSTAVMNAERYAVQFAKDTKSTLRFFHVNNSVVASDILSLNPAVMEIDRTEMELKKLMHHVSELLYSLNINPDELNYECYVGEGLASQTIISEANEWQADFIIVGTHGISGLRDLTMGTHAWNIIKKAGAPVLAIPENAMYAGIKHIVFATEYREGEIHVINFLTQLARLFDAEVNLLHISTQTLSKEFEKERFENFTKEIKNKIGYKKLNLNTENYQDIVTGLNAFCERAKADWLVMSPEKPFFLEKIFSPNSSITRKVSLHTHIPLLTIPDFNNPINKEFWENK